jgi:membrane-bound lytic murein transglycosylase D
VALAAKLAEVPLNDFRALNPSASKPVLLAAGTPSILLPWDNAEVFQANLEAYGGSGLASWTAWIAPTTLKPADAANRFNMSESELREVNNIKGRMLIRAGSTLLVRRDSSVLNDVSNHVADNGQLTLAPEIVLHKTSVKAGKKDSVVSLAKRYGLNVAEVARWNNVSASAAFKAGQQVVVYLPARAMRAVKASSSTKNTQPAKSTRTSKSPSPQKTANVPVRKKAGITPKKTAPAKKK